MTNLLPWIKKYYQLLSIVGAALGVITTLFVGVYHPLVIENGDLRAELSTCSGSKSIIESDYKVCRDKLNSKVLSGSTEDTTEDPASGFSDFIRDWEISPDFYVKKDTNLICPTKRGNRNYQRVYYRKEITPKNAKLTLKMKILDEKDSLIYAQRFVTGLASSNGNKVLSEFDIPTKDGQVISFNEFYNNGNQKPSQKGTELPSPLMGNTVINLSYEINHKQGTTLTEIVKLIYIPAIEKYGVQTPNIPYDTEVDDADPDNLPLKLFIGSYVGGCLEILDWSVTF